MLRPLECVDSRPAGHGAEPLHNAGLGQQFDANFRWQRQKFGLELGCQLYRLHRQII